MADPTQGDGAVPHLAFELGGVRLALPLARVRTVVRPPVLTELPLGPPAVAGLANLHGAVTVVIDLGPALGRERQAATGARRVLVLDHEAPVALLADRVLGMRGIAPGTVTPVAEGDEGAGLLAGLAGGEDGGTRVLDLARVLGHVLSEGARAPSRAPRPAGAAAGAAEAAAPVPRRTLVSFESDGEEYALPVAAVAEIVALPAEVSRVPQARGPVLGMVTLRGRLVTLLSARALLGLPPAGPGAPAKVLVLAGGDGGAVGLVVDRPRSILAVEEALVEPVPALLERAVSGEIAGICRLEGGRRLVSVIDPARLLARSSGGPGPAPGAGEAGMDAGGEVAREEFVGFRLGRGEYGIPVAAVEEVVRLPDTLLPVPMAPPTLAGVFTLRGEVLPVMDAHRRFGLPPGAARHVVVLRSGDLRFGLRVDAVTSVLKLPADAIEPAPGLAMAVPPLVSRIARLDGRMVLLLEAGRLVGPEEGEALAAAVPGTAGGAP